MKEWTLQASAEGTKHKREKKIVYDLCTAQSEKLNQSRKSDQTRFGTKW